MSTIFSVTMFITFLLISFFAYNAKALNDAEGRKMFEEHVKKCAEDLKVNEADLSGLHKLEVPTKTEVKCVLACAYKAIGTMTKEGKYDIKKGYEFAELMEDGDAKRLENGKKVADICSAVNDEPVTDGEKGCDRAALMFKCMLEHAPKYGFKLE